MGKFLAENLGTILVTLLLAGIVALILIRMARDKKQGKTSCGCNCAHCAMAGQCHKAESRK